MPNPRLLLPVGLLVCVVAVAQEAAPRRIGGWHTDFAKAEAEAKRLGRPLLVHFHATWCGPCRRMEREVLNTPEVLAQLDAAFVAVKVDSDLYPELTRKCVVRALPSDVVLDPFSGRVIGQAEGFRDVPAYLSGAVRMAAQFEQTHRTQLAQAIPQPAKPKPPAPSTPTQSAPTQNVVKIDLGKAEAIVGMDGYSPVALATNRTWVKGKPEFASEYKGVLYYLASAEELQRFHLYPSGYAPQLLGCDPVVLSETDRAIAGTPRFGAFYDGELFLFVSADSRARFRDNPTRYTRTQHVLRVDQIERTAVR